MNRDHVFHRRVKKFCFCWKNVSWYSGLRLIAWMTMCFGIIEFIIFTGVVLRGAPSNINMCLLFFEFCITVISELVIFVTLGLLLWIGLRIGKIKLIKAFPWGMLIGYILASVYLLLILIQGEFIVKSLVWGDHGITIKSDPLRERKFFITQQIIFYTITIILISAIVLFTTYIIILSLSWINKLEDEIKN